MFDVFIYIFIFSISNSVKHEYSEWDDKKLNVQTCNPSAKITPTSNIPQEVAAEKYVVFSFDVTFQVCNHINSLLLSIKYVSYSNLSLTVQ